MVQSGLGKLFPLCVTESREKGKYCHPPVITRELQEKQQQFIEFSASNLQILSNVLWVKMVVLVACSFSGDSL